MESDGEDLDDSRGVVLLGGSDGSDGGLEIVAGEGEEGRGREGQLRED